MAKFLRYEDRLEIEGALKEQMSFTEIGKNVAGKRYVEQRLVNIQWYRYVNNVKRYAAVIAKSLRKRYVCIDTNHPMSVMDAGNERDVR